MNSNYWPPFKCQILAKNTQKWPFLAVFLGAYLNASPYGFETIRNGFPIKFYVPMTFYGHSLKLFFSLKEKKSHFWAFWLFTSLFWLAIPRPILI